MDGRKRWRQNEMARVKITFVYHSIQGRVSRNRLVFEVFWITMDGMNH